MFGWSFFLLFVFYVLDSIENALCTHRERNKNENNKYNAMKFVKHKVEKCFFRYKTNIMSGELRALSKMVKHFSVKDNTD